MIANPNCTTAILLMALQPIMKSCGHNNKLLRAIVSTYQAASGAGIKGIEEVTSQCKAVVDANGPSGGDGKIEQVQEQSNTVKPNTVFARQLAYNVIPQIDALLENGYTKEEMKVTWETRKILGLPTLPVSCTAVRVPVLRAHSESVCLEFEGEVDLVGVIRALVEADGVVVVDNFDDNGQAIPLVDAKGSPKYPTPLTASGNDDVEVGRIRHSQVFGKNGLEFFVSGDQLLRGAALNAVLIAVKL